MTRLYGVATQVSHQNGAETSGGAVQVRGRVVQNANGRSVLFGRHSKLPGNGARVHLVVDAAYLGNRHERERMRVNSEHDLLFCDWRSLKRVYLHKQTKFENDVGIEIFANVLD